MIRADEIRPVGKVVKTHGIDGELSVAFDIDCFDEVVDEGTCLVFDIDGIYVPFFVSSVRPRGNGALLLSLDGEDTQPQAATFVGREVYMLADDLGETDEIDDDQLYAADLVGYTAVDSELGELGTITGYDDSTDNPLFMVDSREPGAAQLLIPIVDEFIDDIDSDTRTITFTLPQGLTDL